MLVFDDACEWHVGRRVVDHHGLLEESFLWLGHPRLLEANGAVLEFGHALLGEVGVDGARVDEHAVVRERALRKGKGRRSGST